jgi:hypothetical protein
MRNRLVFPREEYQVTDTYLIGKRVTRHYALSSILPTLEVGAGAQAPRRRFV